MLQALIRTITEILDSKKAAYSFIAVILAIVLHVKFDVSIQDAMLLVSPLAIATAAQAHVDARQGSGSSGGNGGGVKHSGSGKHSPAAPPLPPSPDVPTSAA